MILRTLLAFLLLCGTAWGQVVQTQPGIPPSYITILDVKSGCGSVGAVGNGVADDSAAFKACINLAITNWGSGIPTAVYAPAGIYLIKANALPVMYHAGVGIFGDGSMKTYIKMDPTYPGTDLFAWSEDWIGASFPVNGNTVNIPLNNAGPMLRGMTIVGDRSAGAQQNAVTFYDRNDHIVMDDVQIFYVKGRGIYSGVTKNSTEAYIRESHFSNLKLFNDGTTSAPVVEFNSQGVNQAANEINLSVVDIYAPYATGMLLRNNNSTVPSSTFRFVDLRIEGLENNPASVSAPLLQIGDGVQTGVIHDLFFHNVSLISPYTSNAALLVTAATLGSAPYNIRVSNGVIGAGAGAGSGININAGNTMSFLFSNIGSVGTNVTVGSSSLTAGPLYFDGGGTEANWTWSVDSTATAYVRTPNGRLGAPTSNNSVAFTSAQVPDGTVNFGNARGANSTDWQIFRFAANQAATGANSTIAGGIDNRSSNTGSTVGGGSQNTNAGFYGTVAGGNSILLSGQFSAAPGGANITDRGNQNDLVYGGGQFAAQGDAQVGLYVLRGTVSSHTGVVLTADQNAASSSNCVNIPNSTAYAITIDVVALDHATPANNESWNGWQGLLTRGANAASTALTMGTKPTPFTNGTVTGSDISAAADTTNGCITLTYTGYTSGTDKQNAVARVKTVEVQ